MCTAAPPPPLTRLLLVGGLVVVLPLLPCLHIPHVWTVVDRTFVVVIATGMNVDIATTPSVDGMIIASVLLPYAAGWYGVHRVLYADPHTYVSLVLALVHLLA